jgi:mono/diheme cytochrome c family protein
MMALHLADPFMVSSAAQRRVSNHSLSLQRPFDTPRVARLLRANGRYIAPLAVTLLLAACGNYALDAETPPTGGGGPGGASETKNCDELFNLRVQPRLDFCRNCHVPQGVADVEDGKLFMLSQDKTQDRNNLHAAWEALGRNDSGKSRLLKMPSGTDDRSHTGGTPWPVGSDAYKEMDALLLGFVNPDACILSGLGGVTPDLPLLGSKHGGHAWFDFCEGKSDTEVLPPDPRALVEPGVNQGKAVHFNAYWKDCHADPELVGEEAPAKTCGELRDFTARGRTLIEGNGAIGAGWYFGGDGSAAGNLGADEYNTLWQKWGLDARPDNFDLLAAERYGMGLGEIRNPYPLPGEDPNATNGGSGQLPTGLTQLRTPDGIWTGRLGTNCHVCHSGQVGTAADGPGLGALYGNANSLSEFGQIDTDLGKGVVPGFPVPVPLIVGKTRGTNNALALQIIVFLLTYDIRPLDPNFLGFAVLTPNGGSLDAPAWWNVGHRPVKFQDGFLSMDALRPDLGFFLPGPDPVDLDWIRRHVRAGDTWLMSLRSPAWPGAIDEALAEQGAILFHSKNLWDANLQNPVPRPQGNGSCAGCHGAYAPRYVNDTRYLDTPALEGVASYIVPRDLIATDPLRVDSDSESAEQYGKANFFAYPETINDDPNLDCSTQNRAEIRQGREPGYLAPPLYGAWASAPFFHNGSVPNVWEVLKPSDRRTIWRRVSTPARPDQLGKVVMGYDTDITRAYDSEKLGWKYDALECGAPGTSPYIDCSVNETDPNLQTLLNILNSSNPYLWYLGAGPTSNEQLEYRKVYNTRMYGQGNAGHEFTSVLTDQERRALIEYLKTL